METQKKFKKGKESRSQYKLSDAEIQIVLAEIDKALEYPNYGDARTLQQQVNCPAVSSPYCKITL